MNTLALPSDVLTAGDAAQAANQVMIEPKVDHNVLNPSRITDHDRVILIGVWLGDLDSKEAPNANAV